MKKGETGDPPIIAHRVNRDSSPQFADEEPKAQRGMKATLPTSQMEGDWTQNSIQGLRVSRWSPHTLQSSQLYCPRAEMFPIGYPSRDRILGAKSSAPVRQFSQEDVSLPVENARGNGQEISPLSTWPNSFPSKNIPMGSISPCCQVPALL